jgi:hypothetical protein
MVEMVAVAEFEKVFAEASVAYQKAFEDAVPQAMVVGSPSSPFGNDIDPAKPVYYVADGVCGFAWVHFPNGRGKFAKFMKEVKGGSNSYYGSGYDVWSSRFGNESQKFSQSMSRKAAGCRAAADVFRAYGVEASVQSRMD